MSLWCWPAAAPRRAPSSRPSTPDSTSDIATAAFGILALGRTVRRESAQRWEPSPATYLLHTGRTLTADSWLRKLLRFGNA